MKTVLRKKNFLSGIPACLLLCITFLLLGSLPLTAGDSTTLGSPGGTLSGHASKNVSGGSNYISYPTPGTYSWTIPDDAASKVWVTLAAGGSGGTGACRNCAWCEVLNGNYGTSGAVGGFVNRQEVAVVPGTVATIVVGAGGPAGGDIGLTYAYSNSSGQTVGGNTCFYHSGGNVCATGGLTYWVQPWCNTYVISGGPVAAGAAGGGVNSSGTGGYARIDW